MLRGNDYNLFSMLLKWIPFSTALFVLYSPTSRRLRFKFVDIYLIKAILEDFYIKSRAVLLKIRNEKQSIVIKQNIKENLWESSTTKRENFLNERNFIALNCDYKRMNWITKHVYVFIQLISTVPETKMSGKSNNLPNRL